MSHRNTRILSGCAALLLCAGLSGCRSVPASRPSASPDPAAHLLGLTAEQRMEDYEYLWSTLRDSYPCWGILEREGVEVERIYTTYREMVAQSDSTVLILGETGTGKELIARAIHNLSGRNNRRMVKMNCAAMPAGLLESDLFGHERGAFTGASAQRIGRFELADKSSLFLDEVGDMPLELQPKLLRVLQEQEFERLGSNKIIQTDVRLIAATNRDLKKMVADREFRSDLYYRLNVFPIHLPPLRERPEDIPLLAKAFTFKIARRLGRNIDSIPAETLRILSNMEWPGNVRELENVIERAVLLTRGNVLQLSLPDIALPEPETPPAATVVAQEGEDEYQLIVRVLKETNGVVAGPKGAAQRLGLKRTTLLSRMKRL